MFVCGECGSSWPTPGTCTACGSHLADASEDPLLGQTVGAYRVARLIGVGGMGRVYKAVHPQIGSRVAIKVLSRECADRRDLVERFFSEARAVNVANHENIVNVTDLAMLPDGRPYIVMEYLDGAPLSSLIELARQRIAPLPLGGVARLAAEVLEALAAAHAKGIVHRDLKPDNIFVLHSGRVKVLDFGVAKLRPDLGGSATHTGSLLGTPYYMSPEQASSRPVDTRADIYAMGVILFECATLNKPFFAPALYDLLKMQVEQPPPSPRALRPDLPVELEQVILVALAKSPDQRFATARAMSTALQHATASLPAEQWSTLVPVEGGRAAGPWQPTPPQSWANKPHPQPYPQVAPPTLSAGQVTTPRQPAPSSRRGVWLVVGALVVAAAGVTVGVVVSGSHGDRAPVAGPEPAPVQPTASPGAPAGPTPVGSSDLAPAPPPANTEDQDIAAQVNAALANVDVELPPEARKQLPPKIHALLDKYGSFAKIPPDQLAAAATDLTPLAGTVGQQVNDALAGKMPASPTHTGAVMDRHDVAIPQFDPKHVDVQAVIRLAQGEAKREVPDAELLRIDLENVRPDGTADLTLAIGIRNPDLTVRFRSPSHAHPNPNKPRGSTPDPCQFQLSVDATSAQMGPMSSCDERPAGPPHCSVADIWKRALLKQPSLSDTVAEITYMVNIVSKRVVWSFTVGQAPNWLAREMYQDDCH
jgi:serine/threonine protein kinase